MRRVATMEQETGVEPAGTSLGSWRHTARRFLHHLYYILNSDACQDKTPRFFYFSAAELFFRMCAAKMPRGAEGIRCPSPTPPPRVPRGGGREVEISPCASLGRNDNSERCSAPPRCSDSLSAARAKGEVAKWRHLSKMSCRA